MKIYTKTGDRGKTSLAGGNRVFKTDIRIEASGTVDELNSYIGLIRSCKISNDDKNFLKWIQQCLMTTTAVLAAEYPGSKVKSPSLNENDIKKVEQRIDVMEKKLPALSGFIIPGGNTIVSYCHIARSVCRRAERRILKIRNIGEKSRVSYRYINRLSDYFFVLARKLGKESEINEDHWKLD